MKQHFSAVVVLTVVSLFWAYWGWFCMFGPATARARDRVRAMMTTIRGALRVYHNEWGCYPFHQPVNGGRRWRLELLRYWRPTPEQFDEFMAEYHADLGSNHAANVKTQAKYQSLGAQFNWRFDEVFDDSQNTAVVAIKYPTPSNHEPILLTEYYGPPINWLEPKDIEVSELPTLLQSAKEDDKSGVWVLTDDLEIKFLNADASIRSGEDFLAATLTDRPSELSTNALTNALILPVTLIVILYAWSRLIVPKDPQI